MEKHKTFTNQENEIPQLQPWNPIFGIGIQDNSRRNFTSDQLPNCYFTPNSDHLIDQRDLFESALSSIVSSPANSHPGITIPGSESIVLRELIGRLGSICNSGEVNLSNSTNTSCYNTPLNSPPKLNLSIPENQIPANHQFPSDPVERSARYHGMESRKLSRNTSIQSLKTLGSQFHGIPEEKDGIKACKDGIRGSKDGIRASDQKFSRLSMATTTPQETTELGDSMEESSVSEQIPGGESESAKKNQSINTTSRKRKVVIPKGKGKEEKVVAEVGKEESEAKRSKLEEGNQKQTKENVKELEAPKDYIHVRAKRGQATDSHSLAERVRREKISERMKFLQDLVPGCNKVTGKAVMLDEIINYVQSLQRQVEFLSMKLATVNPRMDVSMEALLSKDMFRTRVSLPTNMNPFDNSTQPFPYGFQAQNNGMVLEGSENQFSANPLMATMHRNSIMKPSSIDGFGEGSILWENDLQSVVKMALGQDQSQNFHGQMKVEL